ncbi:MAG TPA: hypothetical protein VGS28_02625 [Candidatus Saccharimonadales bacterium]|nr:hypothetical protein [Candidatus Saccharimonadales bacterium]
MSAAQSASKGKTASGLPMKLPTWLSKTNFYIFEYAIGLLALLVAALLLDRALYVLFQYINDRSTVENLGEVAVHTVGLAVVWLPLAMVLYLRTRSQEQAQRSLEENKLRRFFYFVFMTVIVISTAVFAYFAIRGLLLWIFDAQLPREALVGLFLPALLSAVVGKAIIWQTMQVNNQLTTQRFVRYFGGIAVIVFVLLFAVGLGKARDSVIDNQTSTDLAQIATYVNNYANAQGAMPTSLASLNLPNSVLVRGNKYGYSYAATGNGEFKVCGDFKAASAGTGKINEGPDFKLHGAGFQCFTLAVGQTNSSSQNLQSELQALGSQGAASTGAITQ